MSSITQTKAEVQKLIKLYNKLQAEAKEADANEATLKAAQAEKLVSQINMLQIALSKTQAKQNAKTTTNEVKKTPSNTTGGGISTTERKRLELENRINHIEDAQKRTRAQIQQLNQAKAELSRLQVEAEEAQKRRTLYEKQLPKANDLVKLKEQIQIRETQYQDIKKQFDSFKQQANKDSELLRSERDTAVERQKQLEKEKMNSLRYGNNKRIFWNGLLKGIVLGIIGIIIFSIIIFKTVWLDDVLCSMKSESNLCVALESANKSSRP
ncbi:hypothetical protein QUF74_11830 [Candidatus Halobeggiatoa sp. HSG11]|nr:hypothetical protein [Candidatus Halobeggiatoa sp. HSG11]